MVEGKPDPSGNDPAKVGDKTGIDGDNPPSKEDPPIKPDGDFVKYETYSRVLGETKKTKDENKALRERLKEYETKEKQAHEEKLKKDGEYQEIIKLRDEELDKTKQRLSDYETHFQDSRKMAAFFDALGGARVPDDYLIHIDTDRIVINPESNEIDKTSVAKYADEFKKKHARIIDVPGRGPGLPSDAPKSEKTYSIEEWKKLPLKERKAKMAAVHQTHVKKT